ncbi:serine/threonine protein kinase ark1, putative [Entamoeba invadens IP1]|uniref:Serine/threonine protein kinase ark1, putative n=1 Tax=Entamoeba invadens IP1 TaxID=370355 RepID=A0A0A1U3T9_ENTIV|nr:serine/threonine protein kinase ark1, putative [Entamoeba invadens IP1]ELP88826.1 serine/threonine protein kinase ark1, putative [Entamoeba invadens IP1]|eukprot:XP_004255597.1 serine/threonine protein kinase ark1, putative [Entamoeba invadens IP1]
MQNTSFEQTDPFDNPIEQLPNNIGKYQRGLLLGQTYAGFIYSALDTETRHLVSLIHVYRRFSQLHWEDVVDYHKKVNHTNVLTVQDLVRDGDTCILITEYCGFGQISDYIFSSTRFNEETVQIIVIQLLNLIHYLSLNSIVFTHLRVSNIFINTDGKVKCFGIFPEEFAICSGPVFVPPDAFFGNDKKPNDSWDVWALGVVIVEMMNGTAPFAEMADLLKLFTVVNAKIPLPKSASDGLKNLLSLCLKKEAKKRCSISDALQDPWVKDVICESDVLDKTALVDYLESQVPYDNYNVKGEEIKNFIEECPSLKPMNEETYQEISELTNLKTTSALLAKIKTEVQESKDIENEEARTSCLAFIEAMNKRIDQIA